MVSKADELVSVLITTFNSTATLPACLESLRGQNYPRLELIIVDNASRDRTLEALGSAPGNATLIVNPKNIGFAAAQNQAIQSARGQWLLSLNPDVMLAPDFISRLVAAAQDDPRIGAVCGKLLRWQPNGLVQKTNILDSAGIYFTRNLRHLDRGADEEDRGQYARTEYVFGATGAAAMYRRTMVDDVSVEGEFFDEDFFAYREDADLAWRAQLMGWRCLYVPEAVGWHQRRVTPERRARLPLEINWHSVKNRFLMRAKNISAGLYLRFFFPTTWRDLMVVGYALLRDWRLISALWHPIWRWPALMRKRKIIQAKRRVPDGELARWFSNVPASQPVESLQMSSSSRVSIEKT